MAQRYGKTHPDTFLCNDLPRLKRDFPVKIPRILDLFFYTDNNQIFGYEIVYEPLNGNSNAVRYGENNQKYPVYEVGHHLGTMLTPMVKQK